MNHGQHKPRESESQYTRRSLREVTLAFRHLPRSLALVWRASPATTMGLGAITLVTGLLPAAMAVVSKLIVDGVVEAVRSSDPPAALPRVLWLVGAEFGLVGVRTLAREAARIIEELHGMRLTDYMTDLVHRKAIMLDLHYYEDVEFYDHLHRAQREVGFRPAAILREVMGLIEQAVSMLSFLAILVRYHWVVLVVLVAGSVPSLFYEMRYSQRMFHWWRSHTETERRGFYLSYLLGFPEFAKEIRLFGLGQYFADMYKTVRALLRRERVALGVRRSIAALGAGVVGAGGLYACYGWITYSAIVSAITLGDMTMYYQALSAAQRTFASLMGSLARLYEANLFVSNLFELLALQPKVVSPSKPRPFPRPIREGIVVDGVHFSYPHGTGEVLRGVNLRINPGEKVALVGENGAGKTTLVKLLCRLYDPTAGRILVDGIDLREFDLEELHSQISIIFQDFVKYEFSLANNIGFGDVHHLEDAERIREAARKGGAEEIALSLPRQYETMLGHRFGEGKDLSVGQWQKVALSRAFMRESQLLIMDEPTAALDARSEYEVFQRLRNLAAGRATVLISHRFSTVRMADHIYVIHEGVVVEHGSHDQLMEYGGVYAKLFTMQAASYI